MKLIIKKYSIAWLNVITRQPPHMFKIIVSTAIILCTSALFFSCRKETPGVAVFTPPPPPPPLFSLPPPIVDTTGRRELIFEDLGWQLYDSGFPGWDEIYLIVPSSPELDPTTTANAEVFLKYDTSANWVKAMPISGSMVYPHIFFFNSKNLIVEVYPLNYGLPGRKASVKVKI